MDYILKLGKDGGHIFCWNCKHDMTKSLNYAEIFVTKKKIVGVKNSSLGKKWVNILIKIGIRFPSIQLITR